MKPVSRSATKSDFESASNASPPSAAPELAPVVERHIGKQPHFAGCAVDLPDRSGTALRAPQAAHVGGVGRADFDMLRLAVRPRRDDRKPIGRACRGVDVGRRSCRRARHRTLARPTAALKVKGLGAPTNCAVGGPPMCCRSTTRSEGPFRSMKVLSPGSAPGAI